MEILQNYNIQRKMRQRNSANPRSLPEEGQIKAPTKASATKRATSTFCSVFITLVIGLVAGVIYFLTTRLGFGKPFPIQAVSYQNPLLPDSALEIVAELPIPPGNIAVSKNGRVFFNFHPEYSPSLKILELKGKQEYVPFPTMEFQDKVVTVLSMRIDGKNRLWLLDFAHHGFIGTPTLFGFQLADPDLGLASDSSLVEYVFPAAVAGRGSMLNDLVIDPDSRYIYIVDTSIVAAKPAIVVYSIESNEAYRVVQGHDSMFGTSLFLNIMSHIIRFGPLGLKINIDSVGLDRSGSTLVYGAVTSDKMYSISTNHLLAFVHASQAHATSSELDQLRQKAEESIIPLQLEKPVSDGLSTDAYGNIWITAIEHGSIFVATPTAASGAASRHYEVKKVAQSSSLLRWPDGLSFGPDGLYITNSALHIPLGRVGQYRDFAPFHILRINAASLATILQGPSMPVAGQ